jgi:YVTN family beta-propeller protein
VCAQAHAAPPWSVAQRWELGAAGRWDYADVDPVRHRLFLSRGDHVQVIGLPSGEVVGEIANTAGVHGVAFAQDLKLGFTSNGRSNSVTVFDLDTLQARQEIKVSGINPDTILYDQRSHKLYTFNGKSADVSVIDAASLKQVATIKLGGRPEFAATDNAGRIYLNIEDKSELDVIDVESDKLVAQWPLQGCDEPTGLALDAADARVFSVCQNRIMAVTDARTGRRITDVAIGARPDAALYDAASKTVFSSNGEGSLTVIRQVDADHYAPTTVPTEKGARTMAFDPASKRVYLPAAIDKVFTVLVVAP